MATCITCDQPLPKQQTEVEFFAQVKLLPADDDLHEWGIGTERLLHYLDAVFALLHDARKAGEDVDNYLQLLGADLTREALRRLARLEAAAEIWEERVTGQKKESASL